MGVYIGKNMGEAYKDGKIQHPSQAVTYIDNVCEKCGHHMSYPHWATNGYACIRCGYTEKQETHSDVEDEELVGEEPNILKGGTLVDYAMEGEE